MTAPTQPAPAADSDQKSQKSQAEKAKEAPRATYDQVSYVPQNGKLTLQQRLPLIGAHPMGGGMLNGVPSANFGQRQMAPHERHLPSYPVQPQVYYPGFVGGATIPPVNYHHFPWGAPGSHGAGLPFSTPPWAPVEDVKSGVNDFPTNNHNHYPNTGDRNTYHSMIPGVHLQQPCLQWQVMKTPNGYILQDMEALTQQEPAIPRAVPAMWTNSSDLTLAKCLENREGITNVYIRGFLPETTDEMLHGYAARFGEIERCKAIVDLETGLCKGFGFVQYYNFDSCENCIRGFYYLGYQASYAQKSRNSRLKDLEDRTSTNIYCTNVPMHWTEADLRRHFEPYRVVSEKISRDEKTGVSKEVGFARFETREIAEEVLERFHNVPGKDGVKLLLRFADTKAQKLLKQQSNERRAYRAGEYNYSVEVVQGSTPSPATSRLAQGLSQASPTSPLSYHSPMGPGPVWTPATTISPSLPLIKNNGARRAMNSWPSRAPLSSLENTPGLRGRHVSAGPSIAAENHQPVSENRPPTAENHQGVALPKTVIPSATDEARTPSPKKEGVKASSVSPVASRREVANSSPKSLV
ncbi:hypothetical protein VTN49DRAFT_4476 [Thermomyces lanuginosus]|uniref:uncharacterized protein n=1 Tax=Thermomyces lanuginosus TaxID=5541 RepID=UPI00374436A4